jgi:hypothetical protein
LVAESNQHKPGWRGQRRRRALKYLACGALLLALLVPHAWVPSINALPAPLQQPTNAAVATLNRVASGLSTIVVVVRRNDTLDQIFRKLALNLSDLANLRAIGATRQLLDRLMPGEQLTLVHRNIGPTMVFTPASCHDRLSSDRHWRAARSTPRCSSPPTRPASRMARY